MYASIGPVWEANHVWLIFVLTVLWTAYPSVFAAVCITLVVPLFLAAVGIILRGTAYALHGASRGPDDHREIDTVFGAVIDLHAVRAGCGRRRDRVRAGAARAAAATSGAAGSTRPRSWSACSRSCWGRTWPRCSWRADAVRVGDEPAAAAFRRRALVSGVLAGAVAVGGLAVVHADAPRAVRRADPRGRAGRRDRLGAARRLALGLVWRRRLDPARFAAGAAVAAVVAGWALAQRPDVLPGLTVAEAAAPTSTLVAVVVAVVAGGIIVFPALGLLFGLVLRGRLDRPRPAGPTGVRADRRIRAGLLGRVALACFVAGAALTVFGPGPGVLATGIVLLLAAAPLGFLAAVPRPRAGGDPLSEPRSCPAPSGRACDRPVQR